MIVIKSKRTNPATIINQYPDAVLIDVTHKATDRYARLSPAYNHGGIPMPWSDGCKGASVDGIMQCLMVFDHKGVDVSYLHPHDKRPQRRSGNGNGAFRGYQRGVWGGNLATAAQARTEIFLPCYLWVLQHKCRQLVDTLRQLSAERTVVLLDYNTSDDPRDMSRPLSHAALVKAYIDGCYPACTPLGDAPADGLQAVAAGDWVCHAKFGQGVVLSVTADGAIATVDFGGTPRRRIRARHATQGSRPPPLSPLHQTQTIKYYYINQKERKNMKNKNNMELISIITPVTKNFLTKRYGHFTDQELVAAAQQGDQDAGAYLCLVRYGNQVVGTVLNTYRCCMGKVCANQDMYLEEDNIACMVASDILADYIKRGWAKLASCDRIDLYISKTAKNMTLRAFGGEINRMCKNNYMDDDATIEWAYVSGDRLCDLNQIRNLDRYTSDSYMIDDDVVAITGVDPISEDDFILVRDKMLSWLDDTRAQLSATERYVIDGKYRSNLSYASMARDMPMNLRPDGYRGTSKQLSAHLVQGIHDEAIQKFRLKMKHDARMAA